MKILALIALLGMIAYLIYSTIRAKEIPDSISDTAYINSPTAFAVFMGALTTALTPVLLETASEPSKWAAFLTIVGLLMVHLTPKYKQENGAMHYAGGILAGIASQVLVAINTPAILLSWIAYIPLFLADKDNRVFWAELICAANTFGFIANALV